MIKQTTLRRGLAMLLCLLACVTCARKQPEPPGNCRETRYECDSCSSDGILGSRHIHTDCSVTCDMICGRKHGY